MSQSNDPGNYASSKADAKAAKARAKAMRPWFKKKRFLLPLALLVIIGLSVAASSGGSDEDPPVAAGGEDTGGEDTGGEDTGVRSSSGNEENPPADDVSVTSCEADDVGFMVAKGTVTNNSSEASDYIIEIAFESSDGATQYGTGSAFVSGLEPGQNTPLDANSLTEAGGEFVCRITEVDRFAAAG
jgi:hypothetical protein